MPSVAEMEAYIRAVASQYGIDPDAAVRVAQTEGLKPGVWQSNVGRGTSLREPSFGPFQLHMKHMGADMLRETGVDPSRPENWRQGIDYALKRAAGAGNWNEWFGVRDNRLSPTLGMRGATGRPAVGTASAGAGATPVSPALPPGSVVAQPRTAAPGPGGTFGGISDLLAKAAQAVAPPAQTPIVAPAPPPAKPIASDFPGLSDLFAPYLRPKRRSLADILKPDEEEDDLYG